MLTFANESAVAWPPATGSLLVSMPAKGVPKAQTLAQCLTQGGSTRTMKILAASLNKVDLPARPTSSVSREPDRRTLSVSTTSLMQSRTSAKTGLGNFPNVPTPIVKHLPTRPREGDAHQSRSKLRLSDAYYDPYLGVVVVRPACIDGVF